MTMGRLRNDDRLESRSHKGGRSHTHDQNPSVDQGGGDAGSRRQARRPHCHAGRTCPIPAYRRGKPARSQPDTARGRWRRTRRSKCTTVCLSRFSNPRNPSWKIEECVLPQADHGRRSEKTAARIPKLRGESQAHREERTNEAKSPHVPIRRARPSRIAFVETAPAIRNKRQGEQPNGVTESFAPQGENGTLMLRP